MGPHSRFRPAFLASCFLLATSLSAALPSLTKKIGSPAEKRAAVLHPGQGAGTFLTSGETVTFRLPEVGQDSVFTGGFRIEAPPGARSIRIQLDSPTPGADLDLFVRFAQDVGPTGAPESDYREAAGLAHRLRSRAARTNEPVDQAAAAEAAQASAEAKIRYDQAKRELPVAEADPQRPGHVINPYTGQSLDRRGVRPGIRIRDPNDSEGERTFFVP